VLWCDVPGCTKAFTSRTGLAYHARHGHTPARANHVCEYPACARVFMSRAGLAYHWRQQPGHHPDALRLLAVVPTVSIAHRDPPAHAVAPASPARPSPHRDRTDPLLVLAQELDEASVALHADYASRHDPPAGIHMHTQHMDGELLADEDDSAAIELGLAPRAAGALGPAMLD
jgi:hypothetical protein